MLRITRDKREKPGFGKHNLIIGISSDRISTSLSHLFMGVFITCFKSRKQEIRCGGNQAWGKHSSTKGMCSDRIFPQSPIYLEALGY